jgi:transcriptional regulator with XRE-family HTH domain
MSGTVSLVQYPNTHKTVSACSTAMTETLSEYVNRILRQKGCSLREVSDRSDGNIDASYVSRIATGKVVNVTTDKLQALARGLGVDVMELCAVIYRQKHSQAGMHSAGILENLGRLTDEEKRAVAEMIHNLLEDKKG